MVTFPANYYNRFDSAKRYKQLLFRAARGLQSAELNEIHATLHYEVRTLGDVIFSDGSLLRGGQVLPGASPGQFTVGQSLFWARGYTHNVPAFTYTIAPTETCTIGIAIKDDVINEDEDAALRDPAVNTRNFNEPGAHRLRMTARWLKAPAPAGEFFFSVIEYVDGVRINPVVTPPELDGTRDLLARYDRRANGSYVVSGFSVQYVEDDVPDMEHILSVSEGVAHVEGYEQNFEYSRRLRVPFATDTRTINNEPLTFTAAGNYNLRWTPIAEVNEVNGIVRVQRNITHGNFSGAQDILPDAPVVSIIAVNQGGTWNGSAFSGGQTFTAGAHYVQSGDYIDWSPSGNEPAPGSQYTVIYQYSKVIPVTINGARTAIAVAGLDAGTVFYVDYKQYIPRYDRIVLTKDGQLVCVSGVPDYLDPQPPAISTGLSLATLYLRYGDTPQITQDFFRAFKMSDIAILQSDITDIKYNIARLSLSDQIQVTDPTTVKRGVFVDPLTNNTLRDAGIWQNAVTTEVGLIPNVVWNMAELRRGANVLLPFTKQSVFEQTAWTKSRNVNPYGVVDAPPASFTLTPTTYRWIAATNVVEESAPGWTETYSLGLLRGEQRRLISTRTEESQITTPVAVPQQTLTIAAGRFNFNEPVDIYFDSVKVQTSNADAQGWLNTTLTTPAWAQSGARQILLVGTVSGVQAAQVFTAIPIRRTTVNTFATVIVFWDPLAQTFTLDEDVFVTDVDVVFENTPATIVDVILMEVQLGIPDRTKAFATKRLYPADVTPAPSGTTWTRATFDSPARLRAGQEYAVVLATDDPNVKVRTAELGAYDPVNGRWVSNNPYTRGVLLESANLSSWAPIGKEDLTTRIHRAVFTTKPTTTVLDNIWVTAATDLMLLVGTDRMPGTSVEFRAILLDRDNETVVLHPYTRAIIAEYTGRISVRFTLSTTNNRVSPIVEGNISLAAGQVQFPSNYVSRALPVRSGTNIVVNLEILEQTAGQLVVEYQNAAQAWVALTRQAGRAVNVGDGWVDMPFVGTNAASGLTATRFRVKLDSANKVNRPAARKLRTYFT